MNQFEASIRETNCKDCCTEKTDIYVDNNSYQSCIMHCIDSFKEN